MLGLLANLGFRPVYRTVPTRDDILVPETLLKKRKSQEKARAERAADLEQQKKVGSISFYLVHFAEVVIMMHNKPIN